MCKRVNIYHWWKKSGSIGNQNVTKDFYLNAVLFEEKNHKKYYNLCFVHRY